VPRRDLVIIPDDQPGVLARIGSTMGEAGLNIEAVSAFTGGGKGVVHLLVDDHETALRVLTESGFDVRAARRVAVVPIDDVPGSLGEACRVLGEAGINIEQAYMTSANALVVVTEDVDGAKAALEVE